MKMTDNTNSDNKTDISTGKVRSMMHSGGLTCDILNQKGEGIQYRSRSILF
jgi:hypothetical protein